MIGRIVAVEERYLGSVLAFSLVGGESDMAVDDVSDFDTTGQLVIDPAGDEAGPEVIAWTDVDDDLGVLTLTGTVVGAYTEGAEVQLYPRSVERWATIISGDSGQDEEGIIARVPHALFDRIPVGIRDLDAGEGETVSANFVSDELVIQDVTGQAPIVDGSYIDPDTIETPEPTDGDPPTDSPDSIVLGGVGFLCVKWEAVTNDDLITYDVHISTSSGFTPDDPTTKVGEMVGTMFFIREMPDGTDLAYGTTYYVQIVARDGDGAAAPGVEGSAQMVKVVTVDLTDALITNAKLVDDAVTAVKIAADAVTNIKILDDAITTAKIAADAVTAGELAANAVDTAALQALAVTTAKLDANAVTTAKIAADAVTAGELAANAVDTAALQALAVTTAKLDANAVTTAKIAADAVTAAELAANAVDTAAIQAAAVTGTSIAANTITAANIAAGTITATEIMAATITGAKIAANTIAAGNIVAGTITATEIAAATITGSKIAANTITASNITAGTITATEIAAATITGAKIAATTIAAGNIISGTITATEIAASTITGGKIAANTITAANITAGTITATEIAASTITGAKIAATTIAAGNIIAGTITTTQIAASTITGSNIAATTITAANIQAGTITTTQIAALTIVAGNIAANTITAAKIVADTITGNEIAANAISAVELAADSVIASKILAGNVTAAKLEASLVLATRIIAGTDGGARVEMGVDSGGTNVGISAYEADGTTKTFSVDASSGDVYVSGRLDFGAGSRLDSDMLDLKELPYSGFQTPSVVQKTGAAASTATTATAPWASPTTTGNECLLILSIWDTDGTVPTPTTPSGWSVVGTANTSAGLGLFIYRSTTGASRSGTQSVTLNDTVAYAMTLMELAGVQVAAEDKTSKGISAAGSTSPASGSTATTAQTDDMLIGIIATKPAGSVTISGVTAGFSEIVEADGPTIDHNVYTKNVVATGAYSISATLSSSEPWAATIVALKAKVAAIEAPDADKLRIYALDDGHASTGNDASMLVVQNELGIEKSLELPGLTKFHMTTAPAFFYAHSEFAETNSGIVDRAVAAEGLCAAFSGTGAAVGGASSIATGGHHGVLNLTTGTTAAGDCQLRGATNGIDVGAGRMRIGCLVRIPTLSTALEKFYVGCGFKDFDATFGTITTGNSIFFRYTHDVNSAKWQACTGTTAASTTADCAVTVNANQWYWLEIDVAADGSEAKFYIDGTLRATIAATMPTTNINHHPVAINKTIGTTARTVQADFYYVYVEHGTRSA